MKKFLLGFKYAYRGIIESFVSRNMKFHFFMTILVICAGIFFKISLVEWFIVIILIAVVWSAEIFNTAIENAVNLLRDEAGVPYVLTGKAKDLAAGAVLVLAVAAAIIGLIIFYPKVVLYIIEIMQPEMTVIY
jgi:diacylglycerol kinase